MKAYRVRSILLAASVAATLTASGELAVSPSDLKGPVATVDFDSPSRSGITSVTEWRLTERYTVSLTGQGGPVSLGVAPSGAWSLGSNGDWAGTKTFAGVDAGIAADGSVAGMRFDVGGAPVSGMGGMFNYLPDITYGGGLPYPLYLAAFGVAGNLLEEHEVPLFTPGALNAGLFYGINREIADIARLEVRGPFVVADNLTVVVPEPNAVLLALAGGLLLRLANRRRG